MAYTTIDKPSDYFNTKLYTGNGSTQSITGVGFQPDLTWLKCRSNADGHGLFDAVRGVNKRLISDTNEAETTISGVTSFDSDGFSLGSAKHNDNGNTFVGWSWLASNTTASNTDGSITSTVSANTTAGFSIVSFTGNGTAGATVGHGLASVPKFIVVKTRSTTANWISYNAYNGNTDYMYFNTNGATAATVQAWNNTSPTSSVFSLGNSSEVNGSGTTMIGYCFSEVKGYSKISHFIGNGSTDGSYIYCGFKPAWVMIKRTDGANSWVIYDNKREGYNVDNDALQVNGNNAEGTSDDIDLLSNGFKMRTSGVGENGSGNSYIFMAFASEPFTTSTGIPTCAR